MPASVQAPPSAGAVSNQSAPSSARSSSAQSASPSGAPGTKSAPPAGAAPALTHMEEAFAGLQRLAEPVKPPASSKSTTTPEQHMDARSAERPSHMDEEQEGQPDADKTAPGPDSDQQKTLDAEKTDAVPEHLKGKSGKVSPWKLVDHYKATNTSLQKEIAELRTQQGQPPKEWLDKLTSAQKRAEELENHIRFVDYQKSGEFTEKYTKPYEEAWMRAISGLKGLKVQWTNPETGEVSGRDITPQDIAALANMDPAAARQEIRQRFPEDAAEVKTYVERIRDLAYAQNQALEEHRTKGAEHWNAQAQALQAKQRAFIESNTKLWESINKEAMEKFDFLRPVEGDEARNAKLEAAVKFVEDALATRITDPKLSDEDRANVLRKHAALRNRAIGYSVLLHENKGLKAKVGELEKALKAYEKSEPTSGDGKGKDKAADVNGEGLMDSVLSGMSKYVRR